MPKSKLPDFDNFEELQNIPRNLFAGAVGTETIELDNLLTKDLTKSGSFDIRGDIWATTFGKVMQALPIPAMLLDRSHKIVAANQACRKLATETNQLVDRLFHDLMADGITAKSVRNLVAEVFNIRKPKVAEGLLSFGDHRIWGRLTFRSIRIMENRMILVLIEDLSLEKKQLLVNQKHNEELKREIAQRTHIENELRESEAKYRELFENANDIVFTHDLKGNFRSVNGAVTRILGYEPSEFLKMRLDDLVVRDNRHGANEVCSKISCGAQRVGPYEMLVQSKNRGLVWVEVSSRAIMEDGACTAVHSIARDISDRKLAEEALRESERRFRDLADLLPQPLFELNHRSYVTFANRQALAAFGYAQKELETGVSILRLISSQDRAKLRHTLSQLLSGQEAPQGQEFSALRKDGSTFPVLVYSGPIRRKQTVSGLVCVTLDITDRKRADAEREKLIAELTQTRDALRFKATHDELSGVRNRGAIMEILHQELARSRREARPLGVIIADIDRFKEVNDEYGHLAGDALLRGVAQRIVSLMREYDSVGRYGGDEFLMILPGCDLENCRHAAERVRVSLCSEDIATSEGTFKCTMSFGVATSDCVNEGDVDCLVRASDEALYRAKSNGRNRVET
ncbi:MAG: PAS domain S-box protein [Desulfomonile sp.]|nr:PAS domain S-box protein [Desulfomonile sp.]